MFFVVKYGGSILNPTGKYCEKAVDTLFTILETFSTTRFCFIIGGGKLCRFAQDACQPLFVDAKLSDEELAAARDEIGIAITKVNARFLLNKLLKKFPCEKEICPNLVLDPHIAPPPGYRVYLSTGYVPGSSTDYDALLLAKTLGANSAIKISDFEVVLDVKPADFSRDNVKSYRRLESMTWKDMTDIVGHDYVPGGSYPLDPKGAFFGAKLSAERSFTLKIGQYSQLEKMISGGEFVGTTVS